MSFCACSRLFQKLSAAISALISPRRFWACGTSKKPPQVRKLVRRGGQFSFNHVEHRRECRLRGRDAQASLMVEVGRSLKGRTSLTLTAQTTVITLLFTEFLRIH